MFTLMFTVLLILEKIDEDMGILFFMLLPVFDLILFAAIVTAWA